jgi:hypothetical protein
LTEQEQTLLTLFQNLSEQDAQTLLRFAEFLSQNDIPVESAQQQATVTQSSVTTETEQERADSAIPQPVAVEKPDNEKVVDALKRLSATYPMLEKKRILDQASALVAQHVMFGQPAPVVIGQIEDLFKKEYDKFVEEFKS